MHESVSSLVATPWAVTSKSRGCQEESEMACASNSLHLVPRKAALQEDRRGERLMMVESPSSIISPFSYQRLPGLSLYSLPETQKMEGIIETRPSPSIERRVSRSNPSEWRPARLRRKLQGGQPVLDRYPTERSLEAHEEGPEVLRASSSPTSVSQFFSNAANSGGRGASIIQDMDKVRELAVHHGRYF